jgi:hypothetical protein
MDVLMNGKMNKVKSTLDKIKENDNKEDIIINKKKVMKKTITKKE